MKSWHKILLCFFFVVIFLSLSIISCFADSSYFETYQAVDSLASTYLIFRNTQTSSVNMSYVAFTDDMFINVGNYFALDLTALIGAASNISDFSLYNSISFSLSFYDKLPSDMLVFKSIPGFIISVSGNGESFILPGEIINNYSFSLRDEVYFKDNSYLMYDTAAGSAQQISQLKNITSLSITIQATSDDENNGYQLFTLHDFINSGSHSLSFGTAFYYYAQAQNENRYEEGYRQGFREGTADVTDRVNKAFENGKNSILNSSYGQDQFDSGYELGHDEGYYIGIAEGKEIGYNQGVAATEGFNLSMIPEAYLGTAYNYVVSLFNYDLFGWNILGIIGAIMVLVVSGFILKKVL